MNGLIAVLGLFVAGVIAIGIWLELRPRRLPSPHWLKRCLLANVLVFAGLCAATMLLGVDQALAAPVAGAATEISLGRGLALIGVGLPTALAAIGAGIAIGPVGSAALAVIAEKPELFGRTLIYMGLAEGVAIYGLVMSILMLGKI